MYKTQGDEFYQDAYKIQLPYRDIVDLRRTAGTVVRTRTLDSEGWNCC
jgi:hypothetical protein